VAPISWLIERDVAEGRNHLNLSQWSEYSLQRRERSLSEIANQVKDGEMPLRQYTLIQRNAKLSEADVNAIFQWTQVERARLRAGQLDQDPMVCGPRRLFKERRSLILIVDQHLDEAVVVVITECRAPRGMALDEPRAGVLRDIRELAVAQIPIQDRSILIVNV